MAALLALSLPAISASAEQSIRYDTQGLIAHKKRGCAERTPHQCDEVGDSAQREGWYWFGRSVRDLIKAPPWTEQRANSFEAVIKLLEPNGDGVFLRHPSMKPFDKHEGATRDQLIPLVAALGLADKRAELLRLWDAMPDDRHGKHAFAGDWQEPTKHGLGQNCTLLWQNTCRMEQACPKPLVRASCDPPKRAACKIPVPRICTPGAKPDLSGCATELDPNKRKACVEDKIREAAKPFKECQAANLAERDASKACGAKLATQLVEDAKNTADCLLNKRNAEVLAIGWEQGCKAARAVGPAACEAHRRASYLECGATNFHDGDMATFQVANHFKRALGEPLDSPILGPQYTLSGRKGDQELRCNANVRVGVGRRDMDDAGNDLNLIMMLTLAQLRSPTTLSREASLQYAAHRPHTYGSYMETFRRVYRADPKYKGQLPDGKPSQHFRDRIAKHIASKTAPWKPEVLAPLGAAKWYHRVESGANPSLVTLYEPIVSRYFAKPKPPPKFSLPSRLDAAFCQLLPPDKNS